MLATMPSDKKRFIKMHTHLLAMVHIITRRARSIRFNCINCLYQITNDRLIDKSTIDRKVYIREVDKVKL